MAQKMTVKTKVMNYMEAIGRPASWSELHEFLIMEKVAEGRIDSEDYFANKQEYRGWFASYFTNGGGYYNAIPKGCLIKPSKSEPRYLIKNGDGLYELAA